MRGGDALSVAQLQQAFPSLSVSAIGSALSECGQDPDRAAALLLASASELPAGLAEQGDVARAQSYGAAHQPAKPRMRVAPEGRAKDAWPALPAPRVQQARPGPVKGHAPRAGPKGVNRQQSWNDLHALFPWADVALVRDVLFEYGWDVDKAASCLAGMHSELGLPDALTEAEQDSRSTDVPSATTPTGARKDGVEAQNQYGSDYGAGRGEVGSVLSAVQEQHASSVGRLEGTGAADSAEILGVCFPWASQELIADLLLELDDCAELAWEWLSLVEDGKYTAQAPFDHAAEDDDWPEECWEPEQAVQSTRQRPAARAEASVRHSSAAQRRDAEADEAQSRTDDIVLRSAMGVDQAYKTFRGEANRASRDHIKYAKGAAAAYRRKDFNQARRFSDLARTQGEKARHLHEKAAQQILAYNNQGNRWELDLHGLHVKEALEVVEQRLGELELEASRVQSQAQTAGHPFYHYNQLQQQPQRGTQHGSSAGLTYGQALSTEGEGFDSGQLGGLAASRVQSFLKREVKIITGVGHHSVGGPTLPKAVESYLDAEGYTYSKPHPGALTVRLKGGQHGAVPRRSWRSQ